ncbi:molybdenum cofactor biosynthesis protein B [Candidatus Frankia alpina]|uniref:MogA/MoaB family molybdenum cofactor biosynthesis protein n=1 Tax=Candidatus Frankia alpina TaxID=2699483 RepID=UPI001F364DCF|nr:molybdopterin-binding protein [Candidatus Frankia alpina]
MSRSSSVPPGARAQVVTVSDRAYRGAYPDRSGPVLVAGLAELGFAVGPAQIVPDDRERIAAALRAAVADGIDLVVTTGGTGLGPRDITPEATGEVIERPIPGLAEALRAAGRGPRRRPRGGALPRARRDGRGDAGGEPAGLDGRRPGGLGVLAGVVGHAVAQLRGVDDHAAVPGVAGTAE